MRRLETTQLLGFNNTMITKQSHHPILFSDDELKSWLVENGEPKYRAKQIFDWIYGRWCLNPDEMLNLPKALRAKLVDSFDWASTSLSGGEVAEDATGKYLLSMKDGANVEAVIIKAPSKKEEGERITFCLSTQVGCAVGCRFCASGVDGLERNMTATEIIEQLLLCCAVAGTRPDNIVFMGIGEPLMNLDNLLTVLSLIVDPARFAMGPRRVTVSTSGWTPGIKRLSNSGRQFNLALSLHGTTDTVRKKIIPDKYRCPLKEILATCVEYSEKTSRMILFEYTLVAGLNDSLEQAAELAELAITHRAKVNLIPMNQVESSSFKAPPDDRIHKFLSVLLGSGVRATWRRRKGGSINAACGQLRLRTKLEGDLDPF